MTSSSPGRLLICGWIARGGLRPDVESLALPSRAVPVLGGRGRLEWAMYRDVTLRLDCSEAQRSRKTGAAILAASPVCVIRVDPNHHRRISALDICRPRASLLAAATSGARV